MAQADRDLELKRATYAAEVNKAREEAEAAGRIERAVQEKAVIRAVTQQKVEEAEVMRLVTEQEVERLKAEKQGHSEVYTRWPHTTGSRSRCKPVGLAQLAPALGAYPLASRDWLPL
eukprot:255415-Prorocentrum_minimum.AAC.1